MRRIGVGLFAMATATLVLTAPTPANAATARSAEPTVTHDFPSADSTVIGSVGFIDTEQVGYFWSMARGDSVTESFTGPARVNRAVLRLDVVENALAFAHVDWTLSLNGEDVGSFQVADGQLGPVTERFRFPKTTGGTYEVKLRVTNEVQLGLGSHSFRYAGAGPHSITLKKKLSH
jgi:hypothetical protein